MTEVPVVFARWEVILLWLLEHTAKFPRRVRFTLSNRIDNLGLDIFERLIEARYTRQRISLLRQINLDLEKLRLLLRLSHQQRFLASEPFSYICSEVDTVGNMIGGWIRQQEGLCLE